MRAESETEMKRAGENSEGGEFSTNIEREWESELEKREIPSKRRGFRRLVHPIRLAQAHAGQVAQSQQPRPQVPAPHNEADGAD